MLVIQPDESSPVPFTIVPKRFCSVSLQVWVTLPSGSVVVSSRYWYVGSEYTNGPVSVLDPYTLVVMWGLPAVVIAKSMPG